MYDGTLTIPDPALVAELEPIAPNVRAYVLRDEDSALDDAGSDEGYVFTWPYESRDQPHTLADGPTIAGRSLTGLLLEARARWQYRYGAGESVNMFGRWVRMFGGCRGAWLEPLDDVDRYALVVTMVTGDQLAAWNVTDTPDPALGAAAVAGVSELVRMHRDGRVYVVRVVHTTSGEESTMGGVRDASPDLTYCRSVARDLACELEYRATLPTVTSTYGPAAGPGCVF